MYDEVVRSVCAQYAKILPSELRYTHAYMNRDTLEEMLREVKLSPSSLQMTSTLLGLTVLIDNSLPDGTAELRTFTPLDEMVARAKRDGLVFNVMKPIIPLPPPASKPTLKALIKYWMRKR